MAADCVVIGGDSMPEVDARLVGKPGSASAGHCLLRPPSNVIRLSLSLNAAAAGPNRVGGQGVVERPVIAV